MWVGYDQYLINSGSTDFPVKLTRSREDFSLAALRENVTGIPKEPVSDIIQPPLLLLARVTRQHQTAHLVRLDL